MRDHHQGGLELVLHGPQDLVDLIAGLGIELAGRFVGENQKRPFHQGASDGHPLLLTAGELVGVVLQAIAQADLL